MNRTAMQSVAGDTGVRRAKRRSRAIVVTMPSTLVSMLSGRQVRNVMVGIAVIGGALLGAAEPAHATFLAQASGSVRGDCSRDPEGYLDGGSLSIFASGSVERRGILIDCFAYPMVGAWGARAESSVSLSLGKLEGFAQAFGPLPSEDISPFGSAGTNSLAFAAAQTIDTLELLPPASAGLGFVTVPVTLTLEGTVENSGGVSSNKSGFRVTMFVGSQLQRFCAGVFRPLPGSFPDCLRTPSGGFLHQVTQFFQVDLSDPFFAFRAGFELTALNSATLDFLGSGTLSVGLPEGFSFRSESGVFLRGAAPIPEPTTLALLGLGLAGLGFTRRRLH